MFNQFGEKNRDVIAKMNERMGTKHRSSPYDLNSAKDLKEALPLAVAAYRDYRHYSEVLGELMDNFDESLENYDTATWFHMGLASGEPDRLSAECADALTMLR
jgi:hypothetical protein